jgi:hypothetical protein
LRAHPPQYSLFPTRPWLLIAHSTMNSSLDQSIDEFRAFIIQISSQGSTSEHHCIRSRTSIHKS